MQMLCKPTHFFHTLHCIDDNLCAIIYNILLHGYTDFVIVYACGVIYSNFLSILSRFHPPAVGTN